MANEISSSDLQDKRYAVMMKLLERIESAVEGNQQSTTVENLANAYAIVASQTPANSVKISNSK